jgi:mRNA interferase RelE/StbE
LSYALRITNSFGRHLRKLGKTDRDRVWKALHELEASPYSFKALTGQLSGTRSARVGNLRVIYAVDEQQKRIILLYVAARERVYER